MTLTPAGYFRQRLTDESMSSNIVAAAVVNSPRAYLCEDI